MKARFYVKKDKEWGDYSVIDRLETNPEIECEDSFSDKREAVESCEMFTRLAVENGEPVEVSEEAIKKLKKHSRYEMFIGGKMVMDAHYAHDILPMAEQMNNSVKIIDNGTDTVIFEK